ncbi:MAG: Hsp33 family molecular chaperone HslO [Oligoflexales bacterium]
MGNTINIDNYKKKLKPTTIKDEMIQGLIHNKALRIALCRVTDTVKTAQKLHQLDPVTTIALGRALGACAVMGSTLKREDAYVQCHFKANDSYITNILAEYIQPGSLRGFVNPSQITSQLGSEDNAPQSVGEAMGNEGTLSVKIGHKSTSNPYTAICDLKSGEIAEDIAHYYLESEQIPTILGAGVHLSKTGEVLGAGAILIQKIAGDDDIDETILEHYEQQVSENLQLSEKLAKGMSLYQILSDISVVGSPEPNMQTQPLGFNCFCSHQRMAMALLSLGEDELRRTELETGKLETVCHFCSKTYNFTVEQLLRH